jgi:hypothetical protein
MPAYHGEVENCIHLENLIEGYARQNGRSAGQQALAAENRQYGS